MNQLQLSSGGKTQKTQNSSNKQAQSFNVHNFLSDIKTPDKEAFEFNSVVSGTKNNTNEKFKISNSVEKFRQKKALSGT